MKKDILIIGTERSGKTTLMNAILDRYGFYEPLRGDAALASLSHVMPKNTRVENDVCVVSLPIVSHEDSIDYLVNFYKEMKLDIARTKRKIIIDTFSLSVEEAVKYFGKTCDIYCLGMPNETADDLEIAIRETETSKDWTFRLGHFTLHSLCEGIAWKSKEMRDECLKYGVIFFDMSGNRDEKIEEAISEIERCSICDE